MTDTLFVTAGLIEDDDIPMNSPHFAHGFVNPGSPGPGAIGQPTSMYNQTRKADDLGLTNLLSQVRYDRAGGVTEYGVAETAASRWDDWGRASQGLEALSGPASEAMKYGGLNNGPKTAPLFPSATEPTIPLHALNLDAAAAAGPPTADAATQALGHLTSLQKLIAPMARSSDEVAKLRKEVEMWKNDWHKIGEEKRGMERAVHEFRAEMEKEKAAGEAKQVAASFSVVLIDGDGLIFQDNHLRAGYKGGLGAAQRLLSSLSPMLAHACISPTSQQFGSEVTLDASDPKPEREVGTALINIFLNKAGLGQTLLNAKIVPDWKAYNGFFEGLSAAHDLITVIDVGPGKEAADAKIREHLKLYARNTQCEMIVLGASHDNGYANILSSLQTESRLSKLLLLKGYTDLAGQLRQYSARVVTIPDLFRTTKVPLSFSSIAAAPATPAPKKAQVAKAKPKTTSVDDDDQSSVGASPGSVEVLEWKEVSKKGPATKKDNFASPAKFKKKANGKKTHSVRLLDPRPCHTYYLSDRGCRTGDDCDYAHDYDLNDEEIADLRKLAKEMICPFVRNNKCHFSEEDCVYGHFCPRGDACKFGDSCRFRPLPNGHGEDE